METIRCHYTFRRWNLFSWLIRWMLPRNRLAMALVSHGVIVDGDYIIEASLWHGWAETIRKRRIGGVRRILATQALAGAVIFETVDHVVPNAEAGLRFARQQEGKPYDFKGAFGLGIAADRDWQEDDCWFCFEIIAAMLHAAGRQVFRSNGHITGSILLLIKQ